MNTFTLTSLSPFHSPLNRSAWVHMHDHCDTFVDSMDWNLFVKEEFETLRRGADDEPSEMYLRACDNVLRIEKVTTRRPEPFNTVHFLPPVRSLSEYDRLMKEFCIIIDTHDLPASRCTKPHGQEYQSPSGNALAETRPAALSPSQPARLSPPFRTFYRNISNFTTLKKSTRHLKKQRFRYNNIIS